MRRGVSELVMFVVATAVAFLFIAYFQQSRREVPKMYCIITGSSGGDLCRWENATVKGGPSELAEAMLRCWKSADYGNSTNGTLCDIFIPSRQFARQDVATVLAKMDACGRLSVASLGCGHSEDASLPRELRNTTVYRIVYNPAAHMVEVS